jgi:hypothetical protein
VMYEEGAAWAVLRALCSFSKLWLGVRGGMSARRRGCAVGYGGRRR